MCVFNGEPYLTRSIESVLSQTFSNFEFIIINDGSLDKSFEIMNSYKDDRIKIFNQANIGLTKSLNKAIKVAEGKFIARLDSDETALPNRFEKQINYLTKNPKIGVLGSQAINFFKFGNKIAQKTNLPISNAQIRKIMKKNNPFIHGSVMIKKEALEEVGFYNESLKFVQDYELWGRISKKYRLQNLPDILVKRIVTRNSITFNPIHMKERALCSINAQRSVLKNLNTPFYFSIYIYKRVILYLLYKWKILDKPYIGIKELFKKE